MELFLFSLGILAISGVLILFLGHFRKLSQVIFIVSLICACGLAFVSSCLSLFTNSYPDFRIPWFVSWGEFNIGIDPLSAFFLLAIACVSLVSGIYGWAYLRGQVEKNNLNAHYSFYLLETASLLLVVTAKNAILFLAAWEIMTVLAYFLVTFYDEKESVRQAGYLYFIATHCGTFCLLAMFVLMGSAAGSMDFAQMARIHYAPPAAGIIFVLALIGFGVKAGFFPLHIWLPQAHPAAPSHISALLSGVVIKTGLYGLLRLIFIIKDLPRWCGPGLLFIGAVSGVIGVLSALGQHEIKKLLAYHSIENVGIIALGIGIGLLGSAYHQETIALIGYAGALLHIFNHAVFKSLLFLSAGSVIRSTATGEIDRMGGLFKYLPLTGYLFLIGSLSICGLPLFNGFISEWLVFRALFEGAVNFDKFGVFLAVFSIVSLALIGGMAAACFAKAFSGIFLGQNRSGQDSVYKENLRGIWGPMAFLAGICLWIGLFPKTIVALALTAAHFLAAIKTLPGEAEISLQPILSMAKSLYVFLLVLGLLVLYRIFLFRRYPQRRAQTWACGYALPSARMQYTASSFAEPILRLFKAVVGFKVCSIRPKSYFPKELELSSKVVDIPEHFIFRPVLLGLRRFSEALLKLQSGHIPRYLLYILLAVVALLLWKFLWGL